MIHLGDITKINGATAPIVDCVIGGSPCQDLSIAGKRAGLAGERSGLYMEQIRAVKEMREYDRANGRTGEFIRPRYMVWENVPGAFSSNGGRDFQSVLTETVRVVEPKAPPVPIPERGWPTSGCLMGDGWSVAWRVLDAQFWGVPQRRRRIALVADFGGLSAPEILFVRKGLSGDPQPGSEKRKGFAGSSESGAAYAVRLNTIDRPAVYAGFKLGNGKAARSIGYAEELAPAPTLNAECGGNKPAVLCLNDQGGNVMGISQDISGTLRAQEHGHQPLVYENHGIDARYTGPHQVAPTMSARYGTGGNNVPLVEQEETFCITGNAIDRQPQNGGNGIGYQRDIAYTLTATDHHAVYSRQRVDDFRENGVVSTQGARQHKDATDLVCQKAEAYAYLIRRLTPLECERLQGFPDGWTDIGDWVDSKGKKRQTTDSARYKALGNSIALPPWKWVLKRLCAQYERDATMASLFDGIGGFPLIWEQLNGKGSCLWASEIEEFPMAVTRKRFE